ncbi:fumarylacetoacetate hydrolase family protein [Vreelandella utahensis]|uniref:fumarylacetoacetate hydrolase family protein n=1 Tax=Vreelandella halophila TaxID=86177 RepID=UPI0009867ECB|nr:fumarylacetoacetate hydrolase family protein [Halomonas utahensis]
MTLPKARFQNGVMNDTPITKVVCVGRNYAEHAAELDNPVPIQPLLFIKPPSAVTELEAGITLAEVNEPVHYEAELALLIGARLSRASEQEVEGAISGLGLALDLTLRETQSQLKKNGHPWEIAKAFDGACPLSAFVPREQFPATHRFHFSLHINGEARQHGDTADMLKPIPALVSYMSKHFTLEPGDVVLTGTPAGVGKLAPGDALTFTLEDRLSIETTVS